MKKPIELTSITGNATSGQEGPINLLLPDAHRIYDLVIKGVAGAAQTMQDGFADLILMLNGKPNITVSAVELDELNSLFDPGHHGVQNDVPGGPFYLPLLFAQWYRKQYGAQEAYSLDIPAGMDAQLQVKFKTGATAPAVAFRGEVERLAEIAPERYNFVPGTTIPQLVKIFRRTVGAGSISVDFNDLIRKDRYQLIRLYNPPGAKISAVQITKDGQLIFKRTKAENDVDLIKHELNPTADTFDIVPDKTDNPADWLDLNGSGQFDIHIDLDQAPAANATIKVISMRWGAPE